MILTPPKKRNPILGKQGIVKKFLRVFSLKDYSKFFSPPFQNQERSFLGLWIFKKLQTGKNINYRSYSSTRGRVFFKEEITNLKLSASSWCKMWKKPRNEKNMHEFWVINQTKPPSFCLSILYKKSKIFWISTESFFLSQFSVSKKNMEKGFLKKQQKRHRKKCVFF